MRGRTVLITGCNTGIGRVCAEKLASMGAHVVCANRSAERSEPVLRAIRDAGGKAEFLPLDLMDLDAVKAAAEAFRGRHDRLHALVCNAGLARVREKTKQGFEATFGVNHLGHYLLARLLLPALDAGAPSRVVVVASKAHERAGVGALDLDRMRDDTSWVGWREYQRSKLCNVLFTRTLARRLDPARTTTYAVHPGQVATDIWRILPRWMSWYPTNFMLTPEQGAVAMIRCASDPTLAGETGGYYGEDGRPREPSRLAQDEALGERLWEQSEAWVRDWL